MQTTRLIGGSFQDLAGNPLANGRLDFTLDQPSATIGTLRITNATIRITLDADGNVAGSQSIYANDVYSTATFYKVAAYTASGQPVWGPNNQTVTSGGVGGSIFDLSQWFPNQLTPFTPSGSVTPQYVTLSFQGPDGNPIANGSMRLTLLQDAVSTDGQQITGGTNAFALDSNGECTVMVWQTSDLLANSITFGAAPAVTNPPYLVEVMTAAGDVVFRQQMAIEGNENFILQDDNTSIILLDGSSVDGLLLD